MAVKRRVEDPLGFEWSRKRIQELCPTVGYVDTVIGNTNCIVHQLLEQQAVTYPVLVTLFRRANNLVIASFRSRNGEALEGGGKIPRRRPRERCGAILPKSVRNVPDAIEYLKTVLTGEGARLGAGVDNLESFILPESGRVKRDVSSQNSGVRMSKFTKVFLVIVALAILFVFAGGHVEKPLKGNLRS